VNAFFSLPRPGDPHCARCGYGWGEYSGEAYDPAKPCPGCSTVGLVCALPALHSGDHCKVVN
jgi:hypothetical protein